MTQNSGVEFEQATAGLAPAPEVREPRQSWWSRVWGKKEPEDRLSIKPEWARAVVKAPFSSLAKYHHPAWGLSDSEAETARPQMQVFLQAVADRYAPAMIGRFATRHAELFDLSAALLVLTWTKYKAVNVAIEAAQAHKPVPVPVSIRREESSGAAPEEVSAAEVFHGAENVECEKCGVIFANAREAGAHLPCKGPKLKQPEPLPQGA